MQLKSDNKKSRKRFIKTFSRNTFDTNNRSLFRTLLNIYDEAFLRN